MNDRRRRHQVWGTVDAIAWAMAIVGTIGVLAWHDPLVNAYWHHEADEGHLFLSQRYPRQPSKSQARTKTPPPTWLAVMRFEADFTVGLLAASVGMIPVVAVARRRDRRTWKRPGIVACLAAVAGVSIAALEELSWSVWLRRWPWSDFRDPFPNAWPNYELRAGLAVVGAWVVLLGLGRWRVGRSAADRVGIMLGCLWLGAVLYRIGACWFIPFANWGY